MNERGVPYERGTAGRNTGFDAFNAMNKMRQSPTGNQLTLDGSFVVSVFDDDPANSLLSPPDGTVVMWNDSGTLRLRGYTRDTGWQTL